MVKIAKEVVVLLSSCWITSKYGQNLSVALNYCELPCPFGGYLVTINVFFTWLPLDTMEPIQAALVS